MKKLFLFGICSVVIMSVEIVTSCQKQMDEVPTCIISKIKEIESQDVTNPPGSIWQYTYDGQIVYYIPPICCDIYSILLDSNCKTICSPDGGLIGKGDGKCPDFFTQRINEKLIWKDSRN